jgi:hypothetical protein
VTGGAHVRLKPDSAPVAASPHRRIVESGSILIRWKVTRQNRGVRLSAGPIRRDSSAVPSHDRPGGAGQVEHDSPRATSSTTTDSRPAYGEPHVAAHARVPDHGFDRQETRPVPELIERQREPESASRRASIRSRLPFSTRCRWTRRPVGGAPPAAAGGACTRGRARPSPRRRRAPSRGSRRSRSPDCGRARAGRAAQLSAWVFTSASVASAPSEPYQKPRRRRPAERGDHDQQVGREARVGDPRLPSRLSPRRRMAGESRRPRRPPPYLARRDHRRRGVRVSAACTSPRECRDVGGRRAPRAL